MVWKKDQSRFKPLSVRLNAGPWLAEARYSRFGRVPITCKLRYKEAGIYKTVMTARGTIAWENMRELAEHFHRRGHVPDLRPISCLADHPRPRWMGPPPPVKATEAETSTLCPA